MESHGPRRTDWSGKAWLSSTGSAKNVKTRDLCPRAAMTGIQVGPGMPVAEWMDPTRRWNVASCGCYDEATAGGKVAEYVGIRRLKDHLSEYVGRVRRGVTVLVTDRGTVVARLIPPSEDDTTRTLRQLVTKAGIPWHGGKPLGLDPGTAPRIDRAASLARAIVEDRE